MPHRLPAEDISALEELSTRFETNIVVISEMDWNNEGEFGGRASQFLDGLKGDIFFNLENSLQIRNAKRYLIGLSLSGLFAVWAGAMQSLFEGVASISGSFWYDGFAEWILKQEDLKCVRYYVSMGDKEKETKVKRFANIEEDTMKVVETLMLKGAEVAFEVTEGGHNSPVVPRIEQSVVSLFEKSVV